MWRFLVLLFLSEAHILEQDTTVVDFEALQKALHFPQFRQAHSLALHSYPFFHEAVKYTCERIGCKNWNSYYSLLDKLQEHVANRFQSHPRRVEISEIHSWLRPIDSCPRIKKSSAKKFFNKYVKRNRPVIITNALTHWPLEEWDIMKLYDKYYNLDVVFSVSDDGIFDQLQLLGAWDSSKIDSTDYVLTRPAQMTAKFGKYLELIFSDFENKNATHYLEYFPLNHFPDSENLVGNLPFAEFLRVRNELIWLSKKSRAGIHFDKKENLMVQLSGEKEFMIVPPEESLLLYVDSEVKYEGSLKYGFASNEESKFLKEASQLNKAETKGMSDYSPVDIRNPDYERFPKLKNVKPWRCRLRKGDVLYLPSYWWHDVVSFSSPTEKDLSTRGFQIVICLYIL